MENEQLLSGMYESFYNVSYMHVIHKFTCGLLRMVQSVIFALLILESTCWIIEHYVKRTFVKTRKETNTNSNNVVT